MNLELKTVVMVLDRKGNVKASEVILDTGDPQHYKEVAQARDRLRKRWSSDKYEIHIGGASSPASLLNAYPELRGHMREPRRASRTKAAAGG